MAISDKQTRIILDKLEAGLTLRAACREADVPETINFMRLLKADDALAQQYAQARLAGYQQMADDLLDVADEREHDANSRRIAVDTRKWLLSKCLPKIYGDRLQVETKQSPADALTDEELAAIIAKK